MALQRINNGKGHWYKLDGDKADGVTTLLKDGIPKPALINWSANSTAEYAVNHWAELSQLGPADQLKRLKQARFADRDQAARRGTEVHNLAEALMHGDEVEVPDELAGHVEAYCRFLDEWNPQPVVTECSVANRKWNYAGTLDMVIDLADGRRVIADIKTSRSGIYGETALQLAAYRFAEFYLDADRAEQRMAELGIVGGLGIWVRGDGYDVYELACGERTFRDFLHVAYVARSTRSLDALKSEALTPPREPAA